MHCLIRRIAGRGKVSVEYHDSELVADSITIGWAADQTIPLRGEGVEARHARITQRRSGAIELRANSVADLRVNGEPAESARLQAGDVVEIGNHKLTVLPEQPGFDLALQLEVGDEGPRKIDKSQLLAKEKEARWITKSRLSWILSVAILAITFAIPVAGLFSERVQETLRDTPLLPSDRLWDTGPLATAHQIPEIANDCTVCHARPFRQVTNDACHACHEGITHHVPEDSPVATEFSEQPCTGCHKEHKEPGMIVRQDQALCVNCHADATVIDGDDVDLQLVSDFDEDHPQFRLTMLVPDATGEETGWAQQRVDADEPSLQERSNLKFNHKAHLNPEGVEVQDRGRVVMQCDDCHMEDAAGALMRPMTMEAQCRECHSLAFDENAPERELPHGHLPDVLASLEEYYSRLGLERSPEVELAGTRKRVARRPGKSGEGDTPDTVLDWARQEARKTAEDLFERSVCYTCHEVSRVGEESGVEPVWKVQPVRLNDYWMPYAYFSHRKHATQECEDCHQAGESEKSTDVLMPHIETCQECHGGEQSEAKLRSGCATCHYLHNPNMGPLYAGAGSEN